MGLVLNLPTPPPRPGNQKDSVFEPRYPEEKGFQISKQEDDNAPSQKPYGDMDEGLRGLV